MKSLLAGVAVGAILGLAAAPAAAEDTVAVEAAFDDATVTLLATTGTDSAVNLEANIVSLTFPASGGGAIGHIEFSATETFLLGDITCEVRHSLMADLTGTYDGAAALQGTTSGQYLDTAVSGCATDAYGDPAAFDYPWTATLADSALTLTIASGETPLTVAGTAFVGGVPFTPSTVATAEVETPVTVATPETVAETPPAETATEPAPEPEPESAPVAADGGPTVTRTIAMAALGALVGTAVSLAAGVLLRRRRPVPATRVERRAAPVAARKSERAELVERIDEMLVVIRERREREGAS